LTIAVEGAAFAGGNRRWTTLLPSVSSNRAAPVPSNRFTYRLTLAQQVQSELFRRAGTDKGQVSINAEDGVVFLGGRWNTARTSSVSRRRRERSGVREVENLLHAHGTPAPPCRSKLERQRSEP
jgi:hypothetical protein